MFPAIPERRIVGGNTASLGQIPSIASLRAFGTTAHFAGGVLISNVWVLSGATYLQGRAGNSVNVHLGIISVTAAGVTARSTSITLHPSFNPITRQNE